MSKTPNLFNGHTFFVTFCYLPEEQTKLRSLIGLNGGTAKESVQDADYIVTDTWEFEDKENMSEKASLVTRKWLEKSLVQGKLLEPKEYSPDPSKLFSGVVACATELESSDVEILSTVIEYLGGSWRSGYTRDVTHLFAVRAGSDKYKTAMHFQPDTGVKVVVPHWFDDTIHFGCRDLDTTAYEWPTPEVLSGGPAVNRIKPARRPDLKALHDLPGEKLDLYENVVAAGEPSSRNLPKNLVNKVWDGKKIILSSDLELTPARLSLVKESIVRCSGEVVEYQEDDLHSVTLDQFDVLVARRRWGHAYLQAVRARKMVGSLAWLFHVQSTGALVPPVDQLLHFPIPKDPVEGFDRQEITVTNYTGQSRDYLKKLIDLMGGKFTASMSGKNTALVAAYLNGQKTDKAQGWGIPVVNHLWLEDCFLQWRTVSVGTEKYIHFPQGLDFAVQLGRSGLDWQTLVDGTQDIEEAMEKERIAHMMDQAQDGMEGLNADDDAEMKADGDEAPADEVAMDLDDTQPHTAPPRNAPKRGPKESAKTTSQQAIKSTSRKAPLISKTQDPDAETSSDEDEDAQSSPTRRPRGRPRRSPSQPRTPASKQQPAPTSRPRRQTGGKAKSNASPTKSAAKAGDTGSDAASPPSSPTRRVTRSMSRQRAGDDDDEVPVRPASRATKVKLSKKAHAPSDEEEEGGEAKDVSHRGRTRSRAGPSKPPSKSKASGTKSASKAKGKASESRGAATSRSTRSKAAPADKEDDRTDTESEDASPTKAAQARRADKANAATSPSKPSKPTRRLSVVMPPVGTGRSLSQQSISRNASPSKDKGKGKALHNDAVGTATTTDSDEDEPPTRTAPTKTPAKTPGNSVPQDLTTPSTAGRARRTAANKATRRLHDEIMPDVNNFQQQLRRGNVRALEEKEHGAESRAKDKGMGKSRNDEEKKRRRGNADDEEDTEEEEEEGRDVKKPRTSGKGKAKAGSEDVEDSAKKRTGKGRAKAKVADGIGDEDQTEVRLMTTGWSMTDAMGKKLQKLGMKLVSDVKQCTHLVTNRIARTPNFLLAMAVAPIIVDQSWLDACVKKGRILPTDTGEYDLNDPGTEAKYGFKLADAIVRAAVNSGHLFEGMTFHVTRSVEVDHKVLRGAIVAHGGTMIDNVTLSERTLQGKKEHYVIASPADDKKFPLLLKGGHKVYTPELVLTSALVQEIRWDSPASILAAP